MPGSVLFDPLVVYIIWKTVKKWSKNGQKVVSFLPGSMARKVQAST
jgi:hypothetical protein